MKVKKRHLTLIEILISITLATMIISSLMFFYQKISILNEKTNKAEMEAFQLRNLQSRLNYLFNKIVSIETRNKETPQVPHKKVLIYTSSEGQHIFKDQVSLVFKTDIEATFHPFLAGDVMARLFIDPEERLNLAFIPSEDKWPPNGQNPLMHREILLEGVEKVSFKFYVTKDILDVVKDKPNEKADLEAKENSWVDQWKASYQVIPAMVQVGLKLKDKKEEYLFYYPLQDVYKVIDYKK